ncbi:Ras guanine nucleotide exchange factor Q [Pelomyxa schiedti]|nr:Ras guanine nucleotide exchange factor Q [Pelomyxa schiedti]
MDAGGTLKFLQTCLPSDTALSTLDPATLPKAIRSGVILINAVNTISPNIAPAPKPSVLHHKINIENFLTACKTLGVSKDDIFSVTDLYNEYNIPQVYRCLAALAAIKGIQTGTPPQASPAPPIPQPPVSDNFQNTNSPHPPLPSTSPRPPSLPPQVAPLSLESFGPPPVLFTPAPPPVLAPAPLPPSTPPPTPLQPDVPSPPATPDLPPPPDMINFPPPQPIAPQPITAPPPPLQPIGPPPPVDTPVQPIGPPPPQPVGPPPPQPVGPPPPQPVGPPPSQPIGPPPPQPIGPPPPQHIGPPPLSQTSNPSPKIGPPSQQSPGALPRHTETSPPPVVAALRNSFQIAVDKHKTQPPLRRAASLAVIGKNSPPSPTVTPSSNVSSLLLSNQPLRNSTSNVKGPAVIAKPADMPNKTANRLSLPPIGKGFPPTLPPPRSPSATVPKPPDMPKENVLPLQNKDEVCEVISEFLETRITPEEVVQKGILKESPIWCPSKPTAPAPLPPGPGPLSVSPPLSPHPPSSTASHISSSPVTPANRPQPPKSLSSSNMSPSNPGVSQLAINPLPASSTPLRSSTSATVNIKQVGGSLLEEISSRWQLKTSSIESVVDENKMLSTDILSLHANLSILKEIGLKRFPEQSGIITQIYNAVQMHSKAIHPEVYMASAKLENTIRRFELLSLLSNVITLKNILILSEEHSTAMSLLTPEQKDHLKEMLTPPAPTPTSTAEAEAAETTPTSGVQQEEGLVYALETKNGVETRELKAGTVQKLVELLFSPNADGTYSVIFMLIFRSFTETLTVLRILFKAYEDNLSSAAEIADGSVADKVLNKKKTRLRIVNIVKRWVDHYWHDFEEDSVIEATKEFLDKNQKNDTIVATLRTNFEKKVIAPFNSHLPRPYVFSQPPPASILPPTARPGFEDMDPIEIARQLSLMEFDIFRTIQAKEMFSLSWSKKDKELKSPNLLAMIHKFNTISNWVSYTICKEPLLKRRLGILKRFTKVLEELIKLNNLNAVFEISSGLSSSSVGRLKIMWAEFKDNNKVMDKVSTLTAPTGNFAAYRDAVRRANPPCIPYLGVYLSDLTFIEEGNPDTTEAGLVNYCKFAMVAGVIQELQRYQQQPYNFAKVESIYTFLNQHVKGVSEKECFDLSLIAEPRPTATHNP